MGIQLADQSGVLETKESKVISADMELYPFPGTTAKISL